MWLLLESSEGLRYISTSLEALPRRFQSITHLRYNYMRALIHRPILTRLLSQTTEPTSKNTNLRQLRGVGQRSLEACVESSVDLIANVYKICAARAQKLLLGTWWCSLYFSEPQPPSGGGLSDRSSIYGSSQPLLSMSDLPSRPRK